MMLVLTTLSSAAALDVAGEGGVAAAAALRFFRCTNSGVDSAEFLSAYKSELCSRNAC